MTGMPASAAFFSGCTSCTLSVGAIRIASGLRAITASSTGVCVHRVEIRRALEDEIGADRLGGGLGALAHGDVEGVRREAGHQRDRELLVLGLGAAKHATPCRLRRQRVQKGLSSPFPPEACWPECGSDALTGLFAGSEARSAPNAGQCKFARALPRFGIKPRDLRRCVMVQRPGAALHAHPDLQPRAPSQCAHALTCPRQKRRKSGQCPTISRSRAGAPASHERAGQSCWPSRIAKLYVVSEFDPGVRTGRDSADAPTRASGQVSLRAG